MDENGIFKRTTLVTLVRPNRKVATCCNHQKRKALGWSLKPIFCGCLTWRFFNANSLLMQNPLGNVLLKPPRAGDWRKICGNQNARSEWNISESIKVESKQDEARCSEDGKEPPDIAEGCQTCLGAPSFPRAFFSFSFSCPDHSSKMQTAVLHLVNKLNNIPDADCLRQFTFVYQYYRTRRWRKFQK